MINRTSYTPKITVQTYQQTIKVETLIAEINALTARIEQLRQRIAISIAQKQN